MNLFEACHVCLTDVSLQSGNDTSKALEETKAFTAQSLASVAYQISSLATNVLKLAFNDTNSLSITLREHTVCVHLKKPGSNLIGPYRKPSHL